MTRMLDTSAWLAHSPGANADFVIEGGLTSIATAVDRRPAFE